MKLLNLFIALTLAMPAYADKKITDLPAQTASAVGTNDVVPMVDTVAGTTRKLKLSQLFLIPSLLTPTFTSVTATTFTGNLTGNVTGALTGQVNFNNTNNNPDTNNSRNIGSSSNQFLAVNALRHVSQFTGGGNFYIMCGLVTGLIAGLTGSGCADAGDTLDPMLFTTYGNNVANATATKPIVIFSGNKTAGTGNSGDITLQTGSSAGGTRGNIILNGNTAGTAGQVAVSTNTTGQMAWRAGVGAAYTGTPTGTQNGSMNDTTIPTVINDASSMCSAGSCTIPAGEGGLYYMHVQVLTSGTCPASPTLCSCVGFSVAAVDVSQSCAGTPSAAASQNPQASYMAVLSAGTVIKVRSQTNATGPGWVADSKFNGLQIFKVR